MIGVRFQVLLFAISTALAAACGGNASISPTAPSAAGAGASGAVIIGQVSGASAISTTRDTFGTLADSSFGTLASSTVTVKITGTNISTTTDGQGQFTLTGVPPGNVQLEFSGQGTNAKIVISGVSAQEEIRISVTLNGNNARVDSEQRNAHDDRGKDQNEVSGPVATVSGTCSSLAFMVKGTKVTTTASTVFEGGACADVKNGVQVEVKGQRGADGTIAATRIQFEDRGKDQNQTEVKGAVAGLSGPCPSLTFTVQGTKVTTTGSTSFDGVTCARVQNGTIVKVKGQRGADGTIAATRVQVEDDDRDENDTKGAVAGLSGTCPSLTFTVQGTKVTTTASTTFDGVTCARVQNGTIVEVKGQRQADGTVAAARVELED